jgi:hypothetical protein
MTDGIPIQPVPTLWPSAITMITFLGVSWLTVTLRMFTRVFLIKSFGADDIAMAVTLVSLRTIDEIHMTEVLFETGTLLCVLWGSCYV